MICSRNELVAALHKALSAAGAPTAVGEEVALAGAWLAERQADAIDTVLNAISSPWPAEPHCTATGEAMVFPAARVAAAGPAALDLLEAGRCSEVSLLGCDSPRLLAGLAAIRLAPDSDQYFEGRADAGDWQALHEQPAALAAAGDVVIRRVRGPIAAPTDGAPIDVDQRAWRQLMQRAAAMYVPSSEQSREAGAGAGLLDND